MNNVNQALFLLPTHNMSAINKDWNSRHETSRRFVDMRHKLLRFVLFCLVVRRYTNTSDTHAKTSYAIYFVIHTNILAFRRCFIKDGIFRRTKKMTCEVIIALYMQRLSLTLNIQCWFAFWFIIHLNLYWGWDETSSYINYHNYKTKIL